VGSVTATTREQDLEVAIEVYSKLIETQEKALPMVLVTEEGSNERELYALTHITDEVRPSTYVYQIAEHYRMNGRVVEQMILQNESWIHKYDEEGNEEGLDEAASFALYNRDGTFMYVIIPFTRMGDGSVHWQPRQVIDTEHLDGDIPDALKEVMS
jgi:hypothetical protein